jgi:hypothetical protein
MNIDDKFSNHVKSVFDEYEDGSADQGWAELLKKYPDRGLGAAKPRKVIPMQWWLGAVAASVLLACFILFFANEQPTDQVQVADKEHTEIPGDTPPVVEPEKEIHAAEPAATTAHEPGVAIAGTVHNTTTYIQAEPIASQPYAEQPVTEQKPVQQEPIIQQVPIVEQVTKENPATAFNTTDQEKKPTSIEDFLDQETKNAPALAANEKKSKSLTSFDIYAGTFLNYFENNPAKMNAGFGVNANVKISKKVYLSVGAGLSENTIAYENSLPSGSVDALTSSFPLSSPAQGLNSTAKPGGGSSGAIESNPPNVTFASKTSGPSTDVSVNAILLNLDIPIALKFYAGKSDRFYVLTGINSNSYINQKYMQSYSTFNYLSNTTETKEQEVEGSKLNGFDFANSAIFAFGISQDLSKSTTLTFEPFYRPSLKGLGDKNIRLNTIGVNLKLNLKGNK